MGLTWIELSVNCPREFVEPLSSVFLQYGHGGVAVEDRIIDEEGHQTNNTQKVRIITYIPNDVTAQSRINQIDIAVKLISGIGLDRKLSEFEVSKL